MLPFFDDVRKGPKLQKPVLDGPLAAFLEMLVVGADSLLSCTRHNNKLSSAIINWVVPRIVKFLF